MSSDSWSLLGHTVRECTANFGKFLETLDIFLGSWTDHEKLDVLISLSEILRSFLTGSSCLLCSSKQTDLQEQLDMRNLQISELQKEIMLAEQDKEKSGDRWAKMTSMTDSKIAVSFLFNSATEAMATATTRAREVIAIGTCVILNSF